MTGKLQKSIWKINNIRSLSDIKQNIFNFLLLLASALETEFEQTARRIQQSEQSAGVGCEFIVYPLAASTLFDLIHEENLLSLEILS